MKTEQQNNRRRKQEKATALLSLVAAGENGDGQCLSEEEMAMLLDNRFTGDELEKKLQHLQSCDACYREWLFLKTNLVREKKRGRIYYLNQLKKLGYVGSALAIAASIVVFFNVYTPPGSLHEEKVSRESGMMSDMKGAERSLLKFDGVETSATEQSDVTPLKTVPEQLVLKKKKKNSDEVSPLTNSVARLSGSTIHSVEKWLDSLITGCKSTPQDMDFWREIRLQGEQLTADHHMTESAVTADKLATVLPLVRLITDKDTEAEQCVLILSTLESNGNLRK